MSSKPVKIEQDEWVIVCDGTKALFLQNAGDSKFPNLQTREVMEQEVPADKRTRHRYARPLAFFGRPRPIRRASRPIFTPSRKRNSCVRSWRSSTPPPRPAR